MIDRGAKIFELAPRRSRCHHPRRRSGLLRPCGLPGLSGAVLDIGSAVGAVYLGERLFRPPSVKRKHPLLRFVFARMPWSDIGQVDRQDVGDQDFRGMTAAGTVWLVFVGEVLAKRALGAGAILWRAARADFVRSVSDDPHRPLSERAVGVPLLGSKPQASAFPWTRHSALISSIAASVV